MLLILLFFTALQRTRVEQPSFTLQQNSQPGAAFPVIQHSHYQERSWDWQGCMWKKKSDKLCFLCKARSEAISAKKTWDMGHFEHFQHKGNSMAEQRALHNWSLLRLQHWSVPTQHHQLSNPTAFPERWTQKYQWTRARSHPPKIHKQLNHSSTTWAAPLQTAAEFTKSVWIPEAAVPGGFCWRKEIKQLALDWFTSTS